MNYKELKSRIRDLGFEDNEAIEENIAVVITGINTAINRIATTVMPIIGTHIIEQSGKDVGIMRYDMSNLVYNFLDFYKKPTVEAREELLCFDDYKIENRKILVLKGSFAGKINCYYKKMPTPITNKTEEEYKIELDAAACELVPLLAAYHIWLDDDDAKAVQYYNMYENNRDELMAVMQESARLKFNGGISWGS